MNSILTPQGEYLKTTFTGSNGDWMLVESESAGSKATSCKDTFTNGKGLYITKTRLEIYRWAEDRKIS